MNSPSSYDRKLLVYVALFLFFLFSLLLVQFYRIQVVEGEKWRRAADRQHKLAIVEPYHRGVFYSNTGLKKGHPEKPQPLVIDVPKFHLYADPVVIPERYRGEIRGAIRKILRLTAEDESKIGVQLEKKSRSRKLVMWMPREGYDALLKWWLPYAKSHKIPRNALFFVHDYKRSYPFGKLLGQVMHTIQAERDQSERRCIPTGGLELSLNRFLKGEDGKRVILRSPRQPLDTGKMVKAPQHGNDVYLTVNHHLQAIVEEEIGKAVKNANAKSGWAIMMDPYTGEILAWGQYPFFDLANSRSYFNDPLKGQETKVKAITDPYEPGSTFKSVTVAIALKANHELKKQGKPPIFTPEEKIRVTPTMFPGRGKVLKDIGSARFANMKIGIQKSSNVYPAVLVQRIIAALGDKWYRSALHEIFGFGEKTGIELLGESGGLLPTPGKKHPNGALEWSKSTPYSMAMGHNILVNSLQMLKCYAVFANGGFEVKPTLIRKIVGKEGQVVFDNTGAKPRKQVLESEIVQQVVQAMRFVTKPGGSAKRADIPGYTEVGKTGTSEKVVNGVYSKKNHISTFIGFAPATQPRFVLLVVIDEPEWKYIPGVGRNQMGGVCAAPAFKEIGSRALHYLGVPEDDPKNEAWSQEMKELKTVFDQWNH